jgi:ankyrin repeat protein
MFNSRPPHTTQNPLTRRMLLLFIVVGTLILQSSFTLDAHSLPFKSSLEEQLLRAVQMNNSSEVEQLLKQGAKGKRMSGSFAQTILMSAVEFNALESAKLLLTYGNVDINAKDTLGRSAINYTTPYKNTAMIKLLISHGCDISQALIAAIHVPDLELVRELLKEGANPNTIDSYLAASQKVTALQLAIATGEYLSHEKKLAERQMPAIVAELITYGANVNEVGDFERTALSTAIEIYQRTPEYVEFLLKHGADPNFMGASGATPLHQALEQASFSLPLIELLIQYGADVNAKKSTLGSPLFSLVPDSNVEEVLATMIKHGANIHAKTSTGDTILMVLANQTQYAPTAIRFLIKQGVDVNAQNNEGWTALMKAAQKFNNLEVIQALLDSGAKKELVNNQGKSAFDLAKSSSFLNTDIIDRLKY